MTMTPNRNGGLLYDLPSPSISLLLTTTLGLQRNSFKVNAIATKYEPTKVKPQADKVLICLEELTEV
ncbi:hypothetical protein L6452_42480 [Arctium lappa]|uniref:Uncharacterized protein n=1 Tax=Arctium lappa TaxID=4217 RepID=A0ACB8XHS0_ARCLA|nr:hypothetical protein L6452_42480 [Arctium lappa]